MGLYNFDIDLPDSEKVVDGFEQLLNKFGYITNRAPNVYFPDWDVSARHPSTGKLLTFEIKFDEMACDTGNVAIEYECRGKLSGISITKADCWVHYFNNIYHIIRVNKLKEILPSIMFRTVTGGDAGSNTKMYLIKIDTFKSTCNLQVF